MLHSHLDLQSLKKGGPVTGINTNYGNPTGAVDTFNITGKGSGLTLNVTVVWYLCNFGSIYCIFW